MYQSGVMPLEYCAEERMQHHLRQARRHRLLSAAHADDRIDARPIVVYRKSRLTAALHTLTHLMTRAVCCVPQAIARMLGLRDSGEAMSGVR